MTDYSRGERAKILYNHIYFSELPEAYRKQLIDDAFYNSIIGHRNFNPRLIEWLASYRRVKPIKIPEYRQFVIGILENPQEIWRHAFRKQISEYGRSMLMALFTLGSKCAHSIIEKAWKELSDHQARKYNYPLSRDGYNVVLKELDGSFVTSSPYNVDFIALLSETLLLKKFLKILTQLMISWKPPFISINLRCFGDGRISQLVSMQGKL